MRDKTRKAFTAFLLLITLLLPSIALFERQSSATVDPLKHIIFIVQENHTFDNYFGTYPGANGIPPNDSCCPISRNSPSVLHPFPLGADTNISIAGDELPAGVDGPRIFPPEP